jgi:hypothetical protein
MRSKDIFGFRDASETVYGQQFGSRSPEGFRELRGSTVVGTRQRAHSNFRFRHESSITAMYPPFYRLLEFCNLLIRGLLPEVLIAEPCINFTRCREGFPAGEGSEVEQTAREVAVVPRVLWCEFPWLIRLVALAIILGGLL